MSREYRSSFKNDLFNDGLPSSNVEWFVRWVRGGFRSIFTVMFESKLHWNFDFRFWISH